MLQATENIQLCAVCKENQKIYDCPKFLNLKVEKHSSMLSRRKRICSGCQRKHKTVSRHILNSNFLCYEHPLFYLQFFTIYSNVHCVTHSHFFREKCLLVNYTVKCWTINTIYFCLSLLLLLSLGK